MKIFNKTTAVNAVSLIAIVANSLIGIVPDEYIAFVVALSNVLMRNLK